MERDRAGREAHAGQRVVAARGFGDGKHESVTRVVGRSAGDAEGVDVAARELRLRDRVSDVGAPKNSTCRQRQPVQRATLRRGDDRRPEHDRLAVHRAVQ